MSDLAVIRLPASAVALDHTFGELPDLTVEVERIADSHPSSPFPFVWLEGASPEAVDRAFEADPTVSSASRVIASDDRMLYEVDWGPRMEIVRGIFLVEGTAMYAVSGADGEWTLHLLFAERDILSSAAECCRNYDIDFDVDTIVRVDDQFEDDGLTDKQYRTLQRATELGYFDVPRGITIEELAEEFDVSHQALSERLRRGYRTLVESTMAGRSPRGKRLLE